MAVTIREVAKHAGVSIGTVSRALNGYKDISPITKDKIFSSVKVLGYTPNVIARGLSSKTALNIGVIVSGLLESNKHDNLWYLMLQGIYRFASEYDLEVAVYTTDSTRQQKKSYTQFCQERNISGAILSGITTTDAYFCELVNTDIPCVIIDVPVVGSRVGCVSIDHIKAAKEMVEYLISLNHKKLILIAGKKNAAVTLERAAGTQAGMAEHGLELEHDSILYCDFSEEKAFEQVLSYVSKYGKTGATAFICMSDIMAFGAIRAIQSCGYSVPEDFSITGFDDIPLAEYFSPSLTTIRQDVASNGYEGGKLLKKLIDGSSNTKHIFLPHQIVIRNSTRKIGIYG